MEDQGSRRAGEDELTELARLRRDVRIAAAMEADRDARLAAERRNEAIGAALVGGIFILWLLSF